MFTAKLEVKYRKNVPTNTPLKIIGKAGRTKGKMAEGWAGIYDENETLLAEANAILINVPQEVLDNTNLDQLGWKIYPE
jgi:hypothetical protein